MGVLDVLRTGDDHAATDHRERVHEQPSFWCEPSRKMVNSAPTFPDSRSMSELELPAVRAPDFPSGLDWIGTDARALTIADLRGRIAILDFWTYG
jgi:hypothetical protein